MGTPAISSSGSSGAPERMSQDEVTIRMLSKAMKTSREQGEAMVRLVQQSGSASTGLNVNYYA